MLIQTIEEVKDYALVASALDIKKILPYVDDAYNNYLKLYMGSTLANELKTWAENRETSEKFQTLIKVVQKPLTRFAILISIDQLDVQLTSAGFAVASTQNLTPASADRVRKFKAELEQSAYDGVDQLLKFLIENTYHETDKPNGYVWTDSDYKPTNWTTLIRTAEDFNKLVNISNSRFKFFQMKQKMEDIETLKIEPTFSSEFIIELDLQIQANEVTEANEKVLKDIRKAIANYTIAEFTPEAPKKQGFIQLADNYLAKALKFIEANIDDYATFKASDCYVSTRTTVKTYENVKENKFFNFGV